MLDEIGPGIRRLARIAAASIDRQNGCWMARQTGCLGWGEQIAQRWCGWIGVVRYLHCYRTWRMLLVFLTRAGRLMVVLRPACYVQTVPQFVCLVCQRGTSGRPTLADQATCGHICGRSIRGAFVRKGSQRIGSSARWALPVARGTPIDLTSLGMAAEPER